VNDPDPRLTPEQEERVRGLLAEARHQEPMPPEVVARLDDVIAGLAGEERAGSVVPLATRRRRARSLLVAAAAVVVVGVGVGQVVDRGGTSADESAGEPAADSALLEDADPEAGGSAAERGASGAELGDPVVTIRPEAFARDARLAQDYSVTSDDSAGTNAAPSAPQALSGCRTATWGQGTFVPVRYGRAPAVLVLRRALGDTQVAELFLCGDRDPLRSVTLPAP
jgi:hypothetical protein